MKMMFNSEAKCFKNAEENDIEELTNNSLIAWDENDVQPKQKTMLNGNFCVKIMFEKLNS